MHGQEIPSVTEFKLPELGENVHQGDLVRLMVTPGSTVSEGQAVIELETDKAVVEVPSSVSGTVKDVLVKQGQKITVGQVIFTVENGAGAKRADTRAAPLPGEDGGSAATAGGGADREKPAQPARVPLTSSRPAASRVPAESAEVAEFRLPELGENVHQGDLVRLMISSGEMVAAGQPVIELETDKAVVEVPSSVSGKVKEVLVRQGQKVRVGEVVFTLEPGATSGGDAHQAPRADESHEQEARIAFQAVIQSEGRTEEQALPPEQPRLPSPTTFTMPLDLDRAAGVEHRGPVAAAPHVRRLARELGVDIHNVTGTGPGGRISEDDVKAHSKGLLSSFVSGGARPTTHLQQPKLPDFAKWGKIERVAIRAVRRKTAEHMWEAWSSIPHVTQHDKADITELEQLRARFGPKAAEAGGKMTVTAIALKVCASALKIFPQFNASIDMDKDEIIYKQFINIGVAVDTDRGLLVPVIRDVDKKNIVELAAELTQLSKKARDKKLSPGDLEAGTFTITNLGGIGGTGFSPIVNYPEVAILGLSRSSMEPVWINGKFEPRMVLPLSLSYDHRLVDGADAARFLRWIAEAFEQPFLLSVQG
ncbi:MAG: dihydrolipoyllysine-residue acetyltransferase [Acidobacteria bacterium]|nr:dihydrolipoyllysine-residue acetyltransferase [Acidobacteriota bacterium]